MESSKMVAVLVIILIIVAGVAAYMFWPKAAAAPAPVPAQTTDAPAQQPAANDNSLGSQIYTQAAASSSAQNPFDTQHYQNPFR